MAMAQPVRSGWTTSATMLEGMKASTRGASWQAFEKLYTPLLNHWLIRDGVPRADWDDLRHEVFVAVLQGLPTFEHTPGRFRGWLRRIARNKVIDLWRERQRTIVLPELIENLSTKPEPCNPELEMLYEQALTLLQQDFQPRCWKAFWLTEVEGKRTDVVAEELGMPAAHVYVYRNRVLRRLRDEFGALLHGEPPQPPTK